MFEFIPNHQFKFGIKYAAIDQATNLIKKCFKNKNKCVELYS